MTEIETKILRSMTADDASFPTSVIASQRVLRELKTGENVNVERLVSGEPLLAAKVLRLANSVAFNNGPPVRNLSSAVLKIGTNNVQTLALILVVDQLRKTHKIPECKKLSDKLWSHSVYVAALCYVIARSRRNGVADEALLLGIVYNLGRFYTLAHITEPTQIIEIVNACHIKARELVFEKLKVAMFLNDACRNADFHIKGNALSFVLEDALYLAADKDPCSQPPEPKEILDFSVKEYADEIYSVVLSLET